DDARAAYTDALTHLDQGSPNRSFVEMKLDDLPAIGAGSAEKKGS
ncbi:MAG: tetratricopeptide repeat protein, partial [Rudaea sp.]